MKGCCGGQSQNESLKKEKYNAVGGWILHEYIFSAEKTNAEEFCRLA